MGQRGFKIVQLVDALSKKNFNLDGMDVYDFKRKNEFVRKTNEINTIFVFCLDGGSYNEYSSLASFAPNSKVNIIYGGSNIYTANEFIEQIGKK